MNVTCFGDSNTYGYDPRSFLGGRYDPDHRWVDILAAENLERFLHKMPLFSEQILLIAPPPMTLGEWVPSQQLIDHSHTFAQNCTALAQRSGIHFANAGDWNISLAYDGVHFTQKGHRAFAAGLLTVLSTLPF